MTTEIEKSRTPADHGGHNYPNAPIKEAVIDIKVNRPKGFGFDDIQNLPELIMAHGLFETVEQVDEKEAHISGSSDSKDIKFKQIDRTLGFRFTGDHSWVLQTRIDRFIFSCVQPYTNWAEFSSHARNFWGIYKTIGQMDRVSRVAVRYINQIEIPFDKPIELKEYFNSFPEVPDAYSPNGFAGFYMKVQIPQVDIESSAVINQGGLGLSETGTASVLFDIDLFRNQFQNSKLETEDEIWSFLNVLRDRKNLIFEKSITDKTRRLFQ